LAFEKLDEIAKSIIKSVPSTVLITDEERKIIFVNKKFEEITGYKPEEVIGKTPSLLKSGRTSSEVYQDLNNCLSKGRAWEGDFINRTKGGQYFWEDAKIFPVEVDGKRYFVKVAEVKSETPDLVSLIFEIISGSNYIILVLSKDLTIRMCNDVFAECVSYGDKGVVIGTNLLDYVQSESKFIVKSLYEAMFKQLEKMPETKLSQEIEYEILCREGKTWLMKWFATVVNSGDDLALHLGLRYSNPHQFSMDSATLRAYYRELIERDRVYINAVKTLIG